MADSSEAVFLFLHIKGAATPFLIFAVPECLIPVASGQDIWHPVLCPTHYGGYGFYGYILAAFDDQFIMDMTADGKCLRRDWVVDIFLTNYQLKCILSIDCEVLGVIRIYLSYQSKKREVADFLEELHNILNKNDFDINTDLIFVRKNKMQDDQNFSTPYTLRDLDYDAEDVVDRLRELKVEEYSETKIDKDDVNPLTLFVFGKDINDRLIYIKLKIRDQQKKIICVSFHYAKENMVFPYAR